MAAFVNGVSSVRIGSSTASSFCGNVGRVAVRSSIKVAAPKRRFTTVMAASGAALEDWLMNNEVKSELSTTIRAMFAACKEISYKVRTASCDKVACFNDFGDEQLAIDILSDKVIFENLTNCGTCATASSEEVPKEVPISENGSYSVAFDPLDGSSIIDTNFSVGTIYGIWPGSKLTGITGRELSASGLCIYGPRTTMSLAIDGVEGAHEFLLMDDFSGRHGSWVHVAEFFSVAEGKLFAPGNLRAAQDNDGYKELIDYYNSNKYQLRYTGGMVPDVNQILVKGKGVFCNPASPTAKAKLRVLYEVAPIGFLMEAGGAKSSEGKQSVLDIPIDSTEVKSQCCFGSENEVKRFEEMVGVPDFAETSVNP
ncbi:hypothetical protein NDN08_004147 [Rhodosorus marinus]|uniref:Sedoheptulose-1,7-bisphosphatase, chloroplastic n=1 Tax=Rhodosorus marinus TaxID=101924 RepID=A0AAV8UHH1_9RHOD|nr:hypothetical protein NDN08_004147 [Rhodosorus marinus]